MSNILGFLPRSAIIIGILFCNQIKFSSQIGDRCSTGRRRENSVCKDVNECEEGGREQCGQLCTNTPGSYYCSCLPGYSLASDQWSCLIEDPPSVILHSYDNHIATMLDTGSQFHSFAESDGAIRSCDYDIANGRAYWVASKNNAVYTSFLNGSDYRVLCNPMGNLGGIAVDWINQWLYWTVSNRGIIERIDLDGSSSQILVYTGPYSPLDIVVEPLNGNIYWIEWGAEPRIQCATLDGSNPKVIVQGSLARPVSLSIDVVDKRIFWMDNGTRSIESANLDGSSRQTVASDLNSNPISLAVLADQIMWTESDTSHIQRADKYTGKRVNVHVSVTDMMVNPVCLQAIHILQQPFKDPLAGYNCTINLSCNTKEPATTTNPYIIYSNTRSIHRVDFNGRNFQTIVNDSLVNVLSLDYDPRDDTIFFADASLKRIERVNLDGSGRKIIVQTDIDSVEGIAVDWMHRKLCWTDSGKVWVACSSLSGNRMKVIAGNGIDKPRGIAIHPALNLVYWTDWGERPKIEAAQLFGRERVTIVGDTMVWPYSLTIDFQRQKLLWVDSGRQTVEMANLDGTGRSIIAKSGAVHQPWAIAQFGNHVWFTEEVLGEIIRLDINTRLDPLRLSGNMDHPRGLQIVHPSNQEIFDVNPCLVFNGGCDHICFRATHNQAACACDDGYRLKADTLSCGIDECLTGMDNCDPVATCENTDESYTCTCPPGYSGDGEICINLNPCLMANGGCDQRCIFHVDYSDIECRCNDGYSLMDDRKSCISDLNPCEINNGGCHQICIHNNQNEVFCNCDSGFDLKEDGRTCIMDECLLGFDNCDPAAVCTNTDESFECTCWEGYKGDGVTCIEDSTVIIFQYESDWSLNEKAEAFVEKYHSSSFTEPEDDPQIATTKPPPTTTVTTATVTKMQETNRKPSKAIQFITNPTLISTTPRKPVKGHIGVEPTHHPWGNDPSGSPIEFKPNERFVNCPVNFEYYCLHGGDCFYSKDSNRAKCLCSSGYMGSRCELLDPTWETPSANAGSSWNLLIIIASVIGLFILLLVILLMFLYCYRLQKHKKIAQPEDVPLQMMRQGSLPMQPNPCNPNTYAAGIVAESVDAEVRKARTLGDYRRLGTFGRRHNDDNYAHIEEDSNHYMIPRPTSNASYSSISTLSAASSKTNQYAETVTPPPPPINQYVETDALYAASSFMNTKKYVPMGLPSNGLPLRTQTLDRKNLASYMSMDDRPLSQHEYWVTINRNGKLDHVYYNSKDKKEQQQ